ncbi:PorP/SprF family type IX secretion system membrane protein [Chitinophaga sedimenti]|uniref:PorP/SprF family type IX secretion system membrane protein n=1 Tax=Chitinophaga sedimenti TaxID=2033606 RepID=UPI0020064C41|nr:PorP/SprF family type IX secretion system membrane protein [Chitinophaga sedimenti]MCK7558326.1 PorP/SprF family type IX secretion system membrane protein [Chitinophaga sedimenti]
MRRVAIFVMLTVVSCLPKLASAQVDPHFAQYYAYPLWLNPALAGIIDGDYRITVNHRTQGTNIGKPYSTTAISADAATNKNIGVGLTLLNMAAGQAGYNYFNAMASVSYSGIKFGRENSQRVVFGIQAGLINRRVDQTKFQLGSQYNPISGFDPNIPSGEALKATSSSVFDASAGALYFDGDPQHMFNPFAGVAVARLTQPEDPFVAADEESPNLPMRYLVHGGTRIKVTDLIGVTPHVLYMRQGNAEEIVGGAYAQIKINPECDLMGGFNYRLHDAVVPFAGFQYKGITLGLSYDVNASDYRRFSNANNAFELSLSFIGRKRRILQPEYFICPRL